MTVVKLIGLAVFAFAGLTGCSTVKDDMQPANLEKISALHKFKNEWRNFVGVGQDARYTRLQPVIFDDHIYTVDVKGHVLQLEPQTGRINWTLDLETAIGGGIGTGGGLLFVGSLAGEVIAIDPVSKTVKWKVQTSSEIVSAPQANDNIVVVSTIDGRVFAFDINDGSKRWNYDHPVPILTLRSNSSPLVKGESVFIGFDNGQLLHFNNTNGQLLWSARVGQPQGKTELERLIDIDADPFELGPYIYAAGYNSRLIAVTRGSGRIMWAHELSTSKNMAANEDTIITVNAESHLKAFNALTGEVIWESKHLHRRGLTAPAIINGMVIVTDFDGAIHGLSLKTGDYIARYNSRHTDVVAQPIIFKDMFYILDKKGEIAAFSIKPLMQDTNLESDEPDPEAK